MVLLLLQMKSWAMQIASRGLANCTGIYKRTDEDEDRDKLLRKDKNNFLN